MLGTFKFIFLLYVRVSTCAGTHEPQSMRGSRRQLCGVVVHVPPFCGFRGSSSGHQLQIASGLPAMPSCQPLVTFKWKKNLCDYVFVCACVWYSVHTCMCVCMWKPEVDVDLECLLQIDWLIKLFIQFLFFLRQGPSLDLLSKMAWPASPRGPFLCLLRCRIKGMYCCAQFWVLGIQIQVPMLVWQTLCPLSHLPSSL